MNDFCNRVNEKRRTFRAFSDDGIVQKSHEAQKSNFLQFASSLKLKKQQKNCVTGLQECC